METMLRLAVIAAAVAIAAGASEVFVEEVGETEIISIDQDDQDLQNPAPEARFKRTPPLPDNDEGSGWNYDDDDDDWGTIDPTSVVPSRQVPTMVSPSFSGADRLIKSLDVSPTKTFPSPRRSSEIVEEGSGNEDYNFVASTISPSRPIDTFRTRVPSNSPLYPITDENDEEGPVIVTDRIPNRKPYIQNRLQKYPVTAGKSIRILIPEDTFNDPEDGNTRNLLLDLRHENGSVIRNSWLRFDPRKQAVYALPVNENNIGQWKFILKATDRQGESVHDTLEIKVRQYKRSRLVNHQFEIEFSFTDWDPASTRDWQWIMLEKVQRLYGDRKPTNIIVRKARENPFVFGWTNDTLTQQSCPKGNIKELFSELVEPDGSVAFSGKPSQTLKLLLAQSKIYVESVKMSFLGTCLTNEPNSPINPDMEVDNKQPYIRNPIDRLNVTAGELLRFKVPGDTCYDDEDGGTERLKLELLTPSRRELSPDSWLQFDSKNQEFVGIPLEEEVGTTEYQFVCSDRKGLIALDGIEVVVNNRPINERFEMEMSFSFADYTGFQASKIRIVENIAEFFGDQTPSNVVLKTFDVDENQVVFVNKSHANLGCDDERLNWMREMLLEPDGKVKRDLIKKFEPYLKLKDVKAIKRGRCATSSVPTPAHPVDRKPGGGTSVFNGMIPSTDYLLTFIIPAVIITCMLILAILLACVLHKKRKAGKLNLFYSEALPPRVPVILQDELYDDNDPYSRGAAAGAAGFKQPVLLPDDNYHNGTRIGLPARDPNEMDRLLQRPVINIDPFSKGSLTRPTPIYRGGQM